jgi:hypothetical protein
LVSPRRALFSCPAIQPREIPASDRDRIGISNQLIESALHTAIITCSTYQDVLNRFLCVQVQVLKASRHSRCWPDYGWTATGARSLMRRYFGGDLVRDVDRGVGLVVAARGDVDGDVVGHGQRPLTDRTNAQFG